MDARPLGERVSAIEADVLTVKGDVKEIKGDVKTLLIRDAQRSGGDSRLRSLVPFVALGVSALSAWIALAGSNGGI